LLRNLSDLGNSVGRRPVLFNVIDEPRRRVGEIADPYSSIHCVNLTFVWDSCWYSLLLVNEKNKIEKIKTKKTFHLDCEIKIEGQSVSNVRIHICKQVALVAVSRTALRAWLAVSVNLVCISSLLLPQCRQKQWLTVSPPSNIPPLLATVPICRKVNRCFTVQLTPTDSYSCPTFFFS